MSRVLLLLLSVLVGTQAARAQLALPSVRLPTVSGGVLPLDVDKTLPGLGSELSSRLQEVRKQRILDLIRHNPKVIEADPNGAPMVRGELVAFSPSEEDLDRARTAGFAIARERPLEGLDARVVVLRAPEGTSTRRALQRLRQIDPGAAYDFNHVYLDSGAGSQDVGMTQTLPAVQHPSAERAAERSAVTVRIGLIDSGVDIGHPVFRDIAVHQHGCSGMTVPAPHGTEVASLMVGRSARFRGAAPGSDLYAADVYCGVPTGGAVDAVVDAFSWLVRERVPVINVSLVGPPNIMLESVVRLVIARGHVVVAAVGNDGPAAPPLYPAAYPDVVGVTAVDARQRVLIEAERGPQVKFAAPGADMAAAATVPGGNPPDRFTTVRGTSFASPIVAALLAMHLAEPRRGAAEEAIADLARRAVDLGAPGPDPIYGYGLVGGDLRPEPALASIRPE